MVSECEDVVSVSTKKIDEMIKDGIGSWFQLGLEALNDWPINFYTCTVIDKKRYLLAKIKYDL